MGKNFFSNNLLCIRSYGLFVLEIKIHHSVQEETMFTVKDCPCPYILNHTNPKTTPAKLSNP